MSNGFEGNLGPTPVAGTIATVVSDPAGVAPVNIIKLSDGWRVDVKWTLTGSLVPMFGGNWLVNVYLDGIGAAFEGLAATHPPIPIATGGTAIPGGFEYKVTLNIPANTPAAPGVYELVTVITSEAVSGGPGAFAAFEEGPLLQFYP